MFLGGDQPLDDVDYMGYPIIDMHRRHIDHIAQFVLDKEMLAQWAGKVRIAYSAF